MRNRIANLGNVRVAWRRLRQQKRLARRRGSPQAWRHGAEYYHQAAVIALLLNQAARGKILMSAASNSHHPRLARCPIGP